MVLNLFMAERRVPAKSVRQQREKSAKWRTALCRMWTVLNQS
jgi:hypothetical protein